jgi:4'-phosphopantetheinyl transferase-like protein
MPLNEGSSISKILNDIVGLKGLAVVSLSTDDNLNYHLPPEKARALSSNAVEKRRIEFALGRAAANLALKRLGFSNSPPAVSQGPQSDPRALWDQLHIHFRGVLLLSAELRKYLPLVSIWRTLVE